jgi:hypothetical protein
MIMTEVMAGEEVTDMAGATTKFKIIFKTHSLQGAFFYIYLG